MLVVGSTGASGTGVRTGNVEVDEDGASVPYVGLGKVGESSIDLAKAV